MIPSLHTDHVRETSELERVRNLIRRPDVNEDLPRLLSRYFRLNRDNEACPVCEGDPRCKVCGGTGLIILRLKQAEALREAFECQGLFAPMRVGSGKTLVTLLLPVVLEAKRPILIVPASLREKTRSDFAALRRAWRVRLPEIFSYEEMGRPDRDERLFDAAPDLLILDEAHRLRNWGAAVTRRVQRYVSRNRVKVAALSGTLITDCLLDFHHLTVWALGANAPVPIPRAEAERWGQALDRTATLRRLGDGALSTLPGGFHEHFRSRRGVVPTPGSDCNASIECSLWHPKLPNDLREMIARTAASSLRPDGELLDDWDLPDCLCQLAQGFYYVWDPLPPTWWLEPRRAWMTYVRAVLDEYLDGFDSPSQIVNALDGEGEFKPPAPAEGKQLLDAWRAVRDQFVPNTVPVWVNPEPIIKAADHAKSTDSIVWVRHVAAGAMLDRMGVPYFGADTDPTVADGPIACSVAAHGTGKNMQAWANNLILSPLANANGLEQLMGRTHRAGQKADVVRFLFPGMIDYHAEVLSRVLSEARAVSKASGFSQKIVESTWVK